MSKKLTRKEKIELGLSKPEISKYKEKTDKKEEFSNPIFLSNYLNNLTQAIQDTRPNIDLLEELFQENLNKKNVHNYGGFIGEKFVNHWVNQFSSEKEICLGDSDYQFKNKKDKSQGTLFFRTGENGYGREEMEIDNIYSFQGYLGFVEVKTSSPKHTAYNRFNRKVQMYLSKQHELFGVNSGILLLFSSRKNPVQKSPLEKYLEIDSSLEFTHLRELMRTIPEFKDFLEENKRLNSTQVPEKI